MIFQTDSTTLHRDPLMNPRAVFHNATNKRITLFSAYLLKAAVIYGLLACLAGASPEANALEQLQQNSSEATVSKRGGDAPAASASGVTKGTPSESNTTPGSDRKAESTSPDSILADKADQEGVLDLSWINRQPASNYTLQMMVAAAPKPLLDYARKKALASPWAVTAFRKDDKVMYLLLQGSYASHDDAQAASARAEQDTGERPWVRRFSSLPELLDRNSLPPKAKAMKGPPVVVLGAAWLWSRNPVRYTIQVLGDRREQPLRAFVAKHRPASPVAIVRAKRNGKSWYMLLAGDYASEEEAIAAIKALSPEMSGRGPWPRRFASLQDQMVMSNH